MGSCPRDHLVRRSAPSVTPSVVVPHVVVCLSPDGVDTAGSDSLFVMDSALFVVCLDHVSPTTLADQSNDFLHGTSSVESGIQTGTCLNRWYDKSLQIIVCENGSAGVNFEHSHLDGHTVLRFASDVFTDTIL